MNSIHELALNVKSEQPWNAQPAVEELIKHPLTPEDLMYCRNHCPVKSIDASTFTIRVDGSDGLIQRTLEYTLSELKSEFEKVELVAALQCAGNRRKQMAEKKHQEVEGLKWETGTICNVRWGGVRMRDILLRAEVQMAEDDRRGMEGLHLNFASHVTACEEADWFRGSIPLAKAMDQEGDVLLAYECNGRPLSVDHGYPFRVVVPGITGVRWVKWVQRITVSRQESDNFYQKEDYKVLPPDVSQDSQTSERRIMVARLPPLQSNTLNSVIAVATLTPDNKHVHAKGYAIPGSSGQVKTVEVSTDEGQPWLPAMIVYQEGNWSWTLWEVNIEIGERRPRTVLSRAVDESGNVQKMDGEVQWNLRGIGYDAVDEKSLV
ncbi:Oxidoreductase, molybdopterin-binding domain-containing protein [Cristinia sonorae]|uniref:Oxidoreductase, molybdopterin-binding domain-containing protein n=1 Tax=Cristinia sonorae TaxID=1940300 RepID=A0A8K0UNK1_9AGAR|nr:Oxidoreductase, molybdopterin-binding domain-containing protein [Cristinia sonorae]